MGMDLAMRRKCASWLWRAIGIPTDIYADMLTGNMLARRMLPFNVL
jgi:hypothetical protein